MSQASNLAGFVTSISPINDLNVGIVTASSFIGDLTGTASTATAAATASYSVTAGVSTVAQGLTGTPDLNVGIVTATSFSGDGSGLSGVGPSQQAVTSSSPTTTIDLSLGNVIYFTHNVDTTVAFANTSTTQEVTFIRTKDDSGTPRSITWPAGIIWPIVGYPPALLNSFNANDSQTFNLVTRDGGSTWYGWEEQRYAGDNTYLFAIGNNNDGPLGQSSQTDYSSPVQIPGTTWSSIAGGASNVLATKTDGTLWAWGTGLGGRLGQNDTTSYSSPTQIPGTTWTFISRGSNTGHYLANKTDGTLWSWGSNSYGQLGQNDRISRSSPTQIPGTYWSGQIYCGSSHTFVFSRSSL